MNETTRTWMMMAGFGLACLAAALLLARGGAARQGKSTKEAFLGSLTGRGDYATMFLTLAFALGLSESQEPVDMALGCLCATLVWILAWELIAHAARCFDRQRGLQPAPGPNVIQIAALTLVALACAPYLSLVFQREGLAKLLVGAAALVLHLDKWLKGVPLSQWLKSKPNLSGEGQDGAR
jgi:hypothetical protein